MSQLSLSITPGIEMKKLEDPSSLPSEGRKRPSSIRIEVPDPLISRIFHRRRSEINSAPQAQADLLSISSSSDKLSMRSLLSWIKNFLYPHSPDVANPTYRTLPIISGIFIPFSILLSIPGLTGHWYIRTEENKTIETRPNTILLDVAMAIGMACSVLANICIVIRFAERDVKRMTLLCIFFLTIHDLIHIPTVVDFGVSHRFDDGFTYGQSFWMTVCSTICSLFTNITLLIDYIQTPDFCNSGSGLTRKQRSLVIIIISLLCYIAVGAMIYSKILDLTFIDALYLTVVSMETLGYGDITPTTTPSKVFTCIYTTLGILNLALAITLIRESLLEAVQVGIHNRIKAARDAVQDRHLQARWREAVEIRLRASGQPIWVNGPPPSRAGGATHVSSFRRYVRSLGRGIVRLWCRIFHIRLKRSQPITRGLYVRDRRGHIPHGKHLNLEGLTEAQLTAAALEVGVPLEQIVSSEGSPLNVSRGSRSGVSFDRTLTGVSINKSATLESTQGLSTVTYARMGRMVSLIGRLALAFALDVGDPEQELLPGRIQEPTTVSDEDTERNGSTPSEEDDDLLEVEELEETFEESLEGEQRRAFYAHLILSWILFITFWMVGAVIFMHTEKWTFGIAIYFCYITFTTLGYGDYSPKTPAGRSIFVVWALLGVGTMTILVSIVADAFSDKYKKAIHSEAFEEAVKIYHEETVTGSSEKQEENRRQRPLLETVQENPEESSSKHSLRSPLTGKTLLNSPLSSSTYLKRSQSQFSDYPNQMLKYTRVLQSLLEIEEQPIDESGPSKEENILANLFKDIPGTETLKNKMTSKTFQDPEERSQLLTMCKEKVLREITLLTEDAVAGLVQV